MKRISKKMLALLMSLAIMLSMSTGIVFAEGESGSEGTEVEQSAAYSGTIKVVDAQGEEITISGEDIKGATSVTVSESEPWTYKSKGNEKQAWGKFYSLKEVLVNAGIEWQDIHGLSAVASDGFTTGFDIESIDDIYIYEMSEVTKGGSVAGNPGTYGTAINGSAGNKWGSDVVSFAISFDHVWFVKDGECKHSCAICGEDEPNLVINPDSESPITVYDCEIQAASNVEATEESPWTGGKNSYVGTFYSLKSILAAKGIDTSECHGITTTASDGFTNGFKAEDIDSIYIYDQGSVLKNGSAAGDLGTYGTAMNGGAGNKWAKGIVSIAVADSHVWFFKDGKCKHYCAICGEDETYSEINAEVPATYTAEGKKAVYKYDGCGEEFGGEAIAKLAKKAQPMTVKAKTATIKYSKLKKKAQTLAVSKTLTVKKAQGTKAYKITKVNKKKSYFKINSKTGKITVKKKLKKGTYKVTVKVTAAGNDSYNAGSITKTIKIKVK